jgi:L,D-transpeptidase ErfK/SrfK
VSSGTQVRIVNQPYKLGWGDDGLYMEAHPPLGEESEGDQWSATELTRVFVAATENRRADVRWQFAEELMVAARGTPALVSVPGTISEIVAETVD